MKWKIIFQFLTAISTLAILLVILIIAAVHFVFNPFFSGNRTLQGVERLVLDFESQIAFRDHLPYVTDEGMQLLDSKQAWIQILDTNGSEAYHYNLPGHAQSHYSPSEIVFMNKFSVGGYTVFTGRTEREGYHWSYLIGFPEMAISKFTFYFGPEQFFTMWHKGLLLFMGTAIAAIVLVGYLFSRWLSNPVWLIIGSIKQLAEGRYQVNLKPKGLYKNVYLSLNHLSQTLHFLAEHRKVTDQLREEWVSNLSHDMKTPLSSIKGYSELLADEEYDLERREQIGFAKVIVRQAAYMEELLQDFKLTFQLKNQTLPIHKQEENIVQLLEGLQTLLLNHPRFQSRTILIEKDGPPVFLACDSKQLRRAFQNLISNALIHNPYPAQVRIQIQSTDREVFVQIRDTGNGIQEQEISRLFERYYRGTNTMDHEGSGLGLAIAKQIIEAHHGTIGVQSHTGSGTLLNVRLPKQLS
ncbi:HAMP domain-containing sensor histidine kinase [Paenibacillus validus]|uniref:HAMP domain-containing sensor histidine kinase n=1 Tax=Paenibacillus TaxID=44249 RepID=UPI000FD7541D|nr:MULTISPECIES: HAMP domain-containing sensor histidine kinase [Paenibacillus]MED4601325.1 HAMP domain-containing sensor histidine kinase [Paenibacillus validus]MED4608050.1 HAMP domain-containing sensor histidine kinase [Paenibacillus validus]